MKYIIDLLEIKEAHQIGSAKDKKLKYASDVDLEEFINLTGSLDDVLKIFQKKF